MLRRSAFRILIPAVMILTMSLPVAAQDDLNAGLRSADLSVADDTTREDLVGLYQALLGGGFEPPPCVDGSERFTDVPHDNPFCPWIEELERRGVTGGCTTSEYCPSAAVTRSQMAIFLVKAMEFARGRFAVVTGDGTLVRGARAVSANHISTGTYEVFFDSDVTTCTYIATVGNPAENTPPVAFATTALRVATTDGIFIRTHDAAGTSLDANFHLLVVC